MSFGKGESQESGIASKIINVMGLTDRISVINTDATAYIPNKEFDILVSETMHSGLTVEPIVEIVSHLSKYVGNNGVILPSKVSVYGALVDINEFSHPEGYVQIGKNPYHVISANWQQIAEFSRNNNIDKIHGIFEIPDSGIYLPSVFSEVKIGSQEISQYQSLITLPQVFSNSNGAYQHFTSEDGKKVEICYRPGDKLVNKARIFFEQFKG